MAATNVPATNENSDDEYQADSNDIPSSLSSLLTELKLRKSFIDVVDYLKDIGLEARFESRKDGKETTRILITHNKFTTKFDRELYFQSNGVVYDISTESFVCIPSLSLNYKPRFADVTKHLNAYKIYRVHDGTIVNLYWYENRWCIGSSNGYEMNNYRWMGPNTYWEEFTTVLKKYPGFQLDTLDKSITYNIGFRCENFHPLKTDPPHCWLVSMFDNTTFQPITRDIGLPFQEEILLDTVSGETSEEKFNNLLTETRASHHAYLSNHTHNYGIIFRGDFTIHGSASHVMIESSLMAKIRKLVYNLPKQHRSSVTLNNTNRLEYITLRSYLTYASRGEFIQLFPELKPRFDVYNKMIADITERMIRGYRNRNLRSKLTGNKPGTKPTLDSLASTFMLNLDKCERLNPMSPQCTQIIYNYIVDPRYLELYFSMLTV